MFFELIIFFLSSIILLFWQLTKRPKNFPPGPPLLPIIGNIHKLMGNDEPQFVTMAKYRKQYGNIVGFRFGPQNVIVLNSFDVIKEGFHGIPELNGRSRLQQNLERYGGPGRGLIHVDGPKQVELKNFVLKTLTHFGFGKSSMEHIIHRECRALVESFSSQNERPTVTRQVFNFAVINVIGAIVFGKQYDYTDPNLLKIVNRMCSGIKGSGEIARWSSAYPWIVTKFPKLSGWHNVLESFKAVRRDIRTIIEEHQKTPYRQVSDNPRDLIDVYLDEIERTTDPNSIFYGKEGLENLELVLFDFFLAGGETTGSSMVWVAYYTAQFPEWQERIYNEIKAVIGLDRLAALEDIPRMPITAAFIKECQRMSAVTPFALYHRTMGHVDNFHGFTIPKDTLIIPNLYGALRDPAVWKNPDTFDPTRFLSEDESRVIHPEGWIPFGTGPRMCLGANLAKNELFLYLTALVQKFHILPEAKDIGIRENGEFFPGIINIMKPHNLIFKKRQIM